jgi:hypothetical protein
MSSSHTSRQLDVFRGFAAILMVLNHAGFQWLAPVDATTGIDGVAVFLGSAAPALFFFATGVGMGLSRRRAVDWPGIARKVVLLLIADLFLGWSVHRWIGLDFFAFCAVSMLAVAVVTATPRPVPTAAIAIAACLVVRYAFVSRLQPLAADYPIVAFVSGIEGVVDVSYPLSPWLVFPLAGFILGRLSARGEGAAHLPSPRIAVAVLSSASGVVAWWLASRGAVMHRWNSVSVAYFLFAIAFVGAVWLLTDALALASGSGFVRALQTRGPASLLIVPVHYGLIGTAAAVFPPPWIAAVWLPAALVLCAVALASSKWIATCLRRWAVSTRVSRGLALLLPACAAVIAFCVVAAPPLAGLLAACLGQVLVAANLARPDAVVTTRPGRSRAL